MTYTKTILCLANSYKTGGRCIAGREVTDHGFGGWIRPISARRTHEINGLEMRYRQGGSPALLEYMRITFVDPQPHAFQTENHLIDETKRWSNCGDADWAVVTDLVERIVGPLWRNGESTYHGLNDKISEAQANRLGSSLILIQPESPRICVENEQQYTGGIKRAVRAHFRYSGNRYIIKVTDPVALSEYKPREDGEYEIENAVFCLSLGDVYAGFAFKLVAAIFTPDMEY